MDEKLHELQGRLGIEFSAPELLVEALTHRSRHGEEESGGISNERLEFLGDAVLGQVVASHLYERFPDWPEGKLTRLKAVAVSEVTLGKVARALDLGEYLLLSKGEEQSGGRERVSLLSDAVEALIGAVYLDQGMEVAHALVLRLLGPDLEAILSDQHEQDYKTLLQELIQERHKQAPVYRVVDQSGPDHARTFVVEAMLGDEILGVGSGRSKKEAEQMAAKQALQHREHAGEAENAHR